MEILNAGPELPTLFIAVGATIQTIVWALRKGVDDRQALDAHTTRTGRSADARAQNKAVRLPVLAWALIAVGSWLVWWEEFTCGM